MYCMKISTFTVHSLNLADFPRLQPINLHVSPCSCTQSNRPSHHNITWKQTSLYSYPAEFAQFAHLALGGVFAWTNFRTYSNHFYLPYNDLFLHSHNIFAHLIPCSKSTKYYFLKMSTVRSFAAFPRLKPINLNVSPCLCTQSHRPSHHSITQTNLSLLMYTLLSLQ